MMFIYGLRRTTSAQEILIDASKNNLTERTVTRYIVLLRGVMPTGKNRIPKMADLRDMLEREGFLHVHTYIQSGNIVLDTDLNAPALCAKVNALIKQEIGPDLPVIALTPEELDNLLSAQPFAGDLNGSRVFLTFFMGELDKGTMTSFAEKTWGEDQLVLTPRCIYMYLPAGMSQSKLSNTLLEKSFGRMMTTRNINTARKLAAIAAE